VDSGADHGWWDGSLAAAPCPGPVVLALVPAKPAARPTGRRLALGWPVDLGPRPGRVGAAGNCKLAPAVGGLQEGLLRMHHAEAAQNVGVLQGQESAGRDRRSCSAHFKLVWKPTDPEARPSRSSWRSCNHRVGPPGPAQASRIEEITQRGSQSDRFERPVAHGVVAAAGPSSSIGKQPSEKVAAL